MQTRHLEPVAGNPARDECGEGRKGFAIAEMQGSGGYRAAALVRELIRRRP